MRLPYEKFLLASIVKGQKIDDLLKGLKIGLPKKEYKEHIVKSIKSSNLPKAIINHIFKPRATAPKNHNKYVGSMGVADAYKDSKAFKSAYALFEDLNIRECLFPLLLLKLSAEEITALLNGKFGENYRTSQIEMFSKYFFDISIMKRADWSVFIAGLAGKEKENVLRAFNNKETEVRADMGLPTKLSVSENYQMMHILATEKFRLLMQSKDPGSDTQALKWAQLAMSSGDKYEKLKVGDIGDFSKDLQIEFDYIENDFPIIGDEEDKKKGT